MTNFCPLFHDVLQNCREGQDNNVPLMAEHPINTSSLYFEKLLASGLTIIHCKKKKTLC